MAALCTPLSEKSGIMDIAPKKANWDLKRDVTRKLARLEKRTQVAIIEMIRCGRPAPPACPSAAVHLAPPVWCLGPPVLAQIPSCVDLTGGTVGFFFCCRAKVEGIAEDDDLNKAIANRQRENELQSDED